jgi:Mu transposase, C-terminal domain/Integrase core domain
VKTNEEIMEILAAYDLTGSYRRAAELAGCDHHTVRRYVRLRGTGVDPAARAERTKMIDAFMPKVEELVEDSRGRIGADQVHKKLAAMGFTGTDRTTRRAVAAAKHSYESGHRRVHRPWIPEPGLWMQWDWGVGPSIAGRDTSLFCAWLSWSRYRVVIPVQDKTVPSIASCLDATFRILGGVPTYCLTDNEKTVTTMHIAQLPVRNPDIVAIGRHYGTVVRTCRPYDPASKGGVENTVKIAKRDLVPTEVNLRPAYTSWGQLEEACDAFTAEVNARLHRETRKIPAQALAAERLRLHPVADAPYTAVFGQTRKVHEKEATIKVDDVRYSVPHQLAGQRVWVRYHGEDLVVTGIIDGAAAEVARHTRSTPGNPCIHDEHYPDGARGLLTAKATNPAEEEFLALGPGARTWLTEAAACGVRLIATRMAEAVALAKLHGTGNIDRALGTAAVAGRFAAADLRSILDHQTRQDTPAPPHRAGEDHSLQPGTSAWSSFGRPA